MTANEKSRDPSPLENVSDLVHAHRYRKRRNTISVGLLTDLEVWLMIYIGAGLKASEIATNLQLQPHWVNCLINKVVRGLPQVRSSKGQCARTRAVEVVQQYLRSHLPLACTSQSRQEEKTMARQPFRDPKLGPAKGPSICECGCGKPHRCLHHIRLVDDVTREATMLWFATLECANKERRKRGLLI